MDKVPNLFTARLFKAQGYRDAAFLLGLAVVVSDSLWPL